MPQRIGVLEGTTLFVKEGPLDAPWTREADCQAFALLGNRIAVLEGTTLFVKEGALDAGWVEVAGSVQSFALSGNRIAVLEGTTLFVKEGPLDAPWTREADCQAFALYDPAFPPPPPPRLLALNEEHQQQTEWCWAATTVSITRFYDPATTWTQCTLVNRAFRQTTCCQTGNSSACNQPWYPDQALTITGHLASTANGPASLTAVENEIDNGRPISIAIDWTGGGGHNPAIDGYDPSNAAAPTIDIQDPFYGQSTQDFNTFPSKYNGGATWGMNYYTD